MTHAVYGLPEMYAAEIRTARLVANPGCYPQTGILGLLPLVKCGLVELDTLIVDSYSGVSGAGRTPKLTTHFPECNESLVAYGVGNHRHTPEIEQALSFVAGEPGERPFHAAPRPDRPRHPFDDLRHADAGGHRRRVAGGLPRGVRRRPVRPRPHGPAGDQGHGPHELFGRIPALGAGAGSWSWPPRTTSSAGASGVAVQNFNLMFGHPETAGLI